MSVDPTIQKPLLPWSITFPDDGHLLSQDFASSDAAYQFVNQLAANPSTFNPVTANVYEYLLDRGWTLRERIDLRQLGEASQGGAA